MRKKLILFLMLALFGSTSFLRADVVEIGDGTGTMYYGPYNSLWGYSFVEQIYTADEIGMAGTINSIAFNLRNADAAATCDIVVYMKNVSKSAFAGADDYENVTPADVVFDGSFTFQPGWSTIILDTPFAYDGTSNLLIGIDENTSGYSTRYFYYTAVTGGIFSAHSDSENPDPTNLAAFSGTKYTQNYRNNIQIDITPGGGGGGGTVTQNVTIGEGTDLYYYYPVNMYFNYSLTEQVYTADEIGTGAGTINTISFYYDYTSSFSMNNVTLYMKNVTRDAFASNTDMEPLTLSDIVWNGTLSATEAGWITITLDTPFAYDGTNLLVGAFDGTSGYPGSSYKFRTTPCTGYKGVNWYSDSYTPDPYNTAGGFSGSKSYTQYRNNIQLEITTAGGGGSNWDPDQTIPVAEVILTAPEFNAQNVASPVTLTWENDDNGFEYKVEFGTTYGSQEVIIDWDTITSKVGSTQVTLNPNTRYFWKVYNRNTATGVDGVASEMGVFTSEFNTPTNVKVVPAEIFTDGSTVVKWSIVGGAVGELPETTIGSGSGTSGYLPCYNLYNYSLTQQLFSVDEIGSAGLINSITFKPQGSITRNLQVYMVNTDKASFSGNSDWITVTDDDLVYSGNVNMASPETTITLEDPFMFDGDHLAIIVNDLTGTWTSTVSYATFDATAQGIYIYQDAAAYNPLAPTGYSGSVANFKNQIIINKERGAAPANRDLVGCNVYVVPDTENPDSRVLMNVDGPITERQYTLTAAHMAELGVTPYNMPDGIQVAVTGVYDYGESNMTYANSALFISGYGLVAGNVKELMTAENLADVTVKLDGKDEFNNTVHYQATTTAAGTYMLSNVKYGTYTITASKEGYEDAVIEDFAIVSTVPVNTPDIIYMHEGYNAVYKVFAAEGDVLGAQVADVIWSFSNFTDPTPGTGGGGGTGGGTGAGTSFSFDFASGFAGWTSIDADGDGLNWVHSSNSTTASGYDYTGLGHTGDCFVYSQSFIDYDGSYDPDNYLISPEKYDIVAGSTLTFWADYANDSYPDHFGVAVATAANPTASDFTVVWQGSAKNGNGNNAAVRHNDNRYENWRQHSIDLSAYAGQAVWIAFRHFNSYDMYEIWIDDVELTGGSKSNSTADECGMHKASAGSREMWDVLASFNAAEAAQYGVVTDGNFIYTSNWGYASATHNFFKYDMEGNMIEGFDISGCGTLRGMTYDGEYFYGVANSSTIYCVDFENKTVVSTISSAYGAMRGITYDATNDGFWVIGNWSGNLTRIDRTGAVQFAGPEPDGASDLAYYTDANGEEHVYCFINSTNDVDDYNITTGTYTTAVFNVSSAPGFDGGSSGGCHIANYGDKLAFYADIQQDPNLIVIYELGAAQGGGSVVSGGSQLATDDHYFQVWRRPVLQENMPTDPDEIAALAIQIAETDHELGFSDTLYTDMTYAELPAGIYEYGIAAVYPWMERNDNNVTGIVWSNDLEHNMTGNFTINATCGLGLNQIASAVVTLDNNNENVNYTAEFDEEGTWSTEEFRKGDYTLTVDMPGFKAIVNDEEVPADGLVMNLWNTNEITINFVEDFAPVTSLVVSQTGFARWTDMLPHDRVAQRYHVLCDEIFQGETTNNYMILNTDNLVAGETYTAAVAVVYETGMSDFVTADFTYMPCDAVAGQVEDLESEVNLADVTLTWAGGTGSGITPPPTGATTFTEGFESGMPTGWTIQDGNNDGWTWCLTSDIPSTWTYYTMALDWYRTGSNAICSGSYINGVGALTPNEYLVTDQVTLAAGSTFSFWAAACDASYPADHFGVFISDDASNWTSVQEWTLTGKGGNDGGRASRNGNGAKLGTWYNYSVDLSAYAGNKYIAIRHFNCNDQYIMCVDDVELSAPGKGGNTFAAAGHGFGIANNALTDDGNWYYYDNGSNEDAIGTGGGNFWWAIMLPAGSYEGNSLTKVAAYDYMAMTGTASIYQGGTTAPAGSALGTVNVTFTGSSDFVEFTFAEPVTIDPSQNVWVVFYNGSGATYPAAVCANTGDANGRWVSLDGTTWEDMAIYDLNYTFMIRAYIENGGVTPPPTPGTVAVTPNAFNIFMDGELIGATTDTTFTYTCNDAEEHTYCVVFIDANYNVSCNQCINVTADPDGIGQYNVVSAIYPNPTNGNLYINTNANMKSISIVNVLGQVVYNKATEGTETIVDMAQFGNGIYMVNIVTENGTSVNRIIVNK